MKTQVFLVDDHGIILDGIESILNQHDELQVAGKASDPNFCLSMLRSVPVDILITDYNMPQMSGLRLMREARKINPALKVIFLSMHDDQLVVQDVLRAGANGYILKKYAGQEILQAISVVSNGGNYWSPEVSKVLTRTLNEEPEFELTDREVEVLKLLVLELTSKEIAEKLFISERTIDSHRKNLLRKTNSKNIVGLIKFAYAHNLLD